MLFELEKMHYGEVRNTKYALAILPWGATEAHNYHLPYGTDNYQVKAVVRQACAQAQSKDFPIVMLPCIDYGINTGQMDIPLCMNMMPSTQLAVLKDICQVLQNHQIPKLLIVNGHGGNHFKTMIRECSVLYPALWIGAANWYQAAEPSQYFTDLGDHAGELETSVMMHIKPDLVRPLEKAGQGQVKKPVIPGMRESWFTTQRPWSLVTEDTGVGNPQDSNAQKGADFMDATVSSLAHLIQDLASTPTEQLYF